MRSVSLLLKDVSKNQGYTLSEEYPNVTIGENVKIGKNCYIYPGVFINHNTEIGDNVIIGAGSIICKDIPTNTKFIQKRFDSKYI